MSNPYEVQAQDCEFLSGAPEALLQRLPVGPQGGSEGNKLLLRVRVHDAGADDTMMANLQMKRLHYEYTYLVLV